MIPPSQLDDDQSHTDGNQDDKANTNAHQDQHVEIWNHRLYTLATSMHDLKLRQMQLNFNSPLSTLIQLEDDCASFTGLASEKSTKKIIY